MSDSHIECIDRIDEKLGNCIGAKLVVVKSLKKNRFGSF